MFNQGFSGGNCLGYFLRQMRHTSVIGEWVRKWEKKCQYLTDPLQYKYKYRIKILSNLKAIFYTKFIFIYSLICPFDTMLQV